MCTNGIGERSHRGSKYQMRSLSSGQIMRALALARARSDRSGARRNCMCHYQRILPVLPRRALTIAFETIEISLIYSASDVRRIVRRIYISHWPLWAKWRRGARTHTHFIYEYLQLSAEIGEHKKKQRQTIAGRVG